MERILKSLIVLTFYIFCFYVCLAAGQGQKQVSMWGEWSQWSSCSKTCGTGASTRIRTWIFAPDDPNKSMGKYTNTDFSGCYTKKECPVNGAWSMWGIWAECSVGCGGGERQRRRECDSPPPSFNGTYCKGDQFNKTICSEAPCPLTPMNFNMSQCKDDVMFTCKDKRMCVLLRVRCDGVAHCSDGSDEINCRAPGYKIGRVHFSNASSQHTASSTVALQAMLLSFWLAKFFTGGRHFVSPTA